MWFVNDIINIYICIYIKYHTVGTVPKFNRKSKKKEKYMTAHIPGLVKDSSIKSDEDKLVLLTQTIGFFSPY